MIEIWRDIIEYRGMYQISNFGKVKSLLNYAGVTERILKSRSYPSGHLYVNLYKNGKKTTRKIHRLVIENFIGMPIAGQECRHMDGNPKNNHANNLQWGTRSENLIDMKRHGTNPVGETHSRSKLNEREVLLIIKLLSQGMKQKDIAIQFGVSPMTVSDIKCNKKWKHLAR